VSATAETSAARPAALRGLRAGVVAAWPALAAILVVGLVVLWGGAGSEVRERTIVAMLINLVLVVGLYVFVGNSGVFSFGHMSFMAIGAYTAGLLTIPVVTKEILLPGLPGWLEAASSSPTVAILAAGAVAALFAALLAVPLMRLSGIAASLATFAVLIAVNVVASNWKQITGATSGLSGVPVTTTLGVAFTWAVIAIGVAFLFGQTRTGWRLRASREDEIAARALGIGVRWERSGAFVLSAFLCGVGGALYAQFQSSFTPEAFYLSITFFTIAMLVVGGMNSLTGAVLGVLVVTAVSEGLRTLEEGAALGPLDIPARPGLREVGLALVLLAILALRPSGLTGGRELPWPGTWRTRRTKTEDDV
jgi:branched-chain amino acid transport system permease protein